jgi:dynein heavy chain
LVKRIICSFATTPGLLQEAIQEELEMKGSYLNPKKSDGNQLFFIDDLSMPEQNPWGDQITLELLRQAIEDEGFYIFKRGEEPKMGKINKTHYVGAMTNPGGGKNDIPNRLKRHFFILNMLPPEKDIVVGI